MITFAEWVRQRRKALDLTQAMLAERVGCAVVTIKKIEQEMRRPSRELAALLADHLAIPAVEREAFLRLARAEYVESSPQTSPAVQPPSFEHSASDNDRPSSFVAREQELAQLDTHLVAAFNGSGRIIFVIGEAGLGKTTLMAEFARRSLARYPNLVVATGNCEAYAGIGDPYLPFRDVLTQLTGGAQAKREAGMISQEQMQRLWTGLPHVARALVNHGLSLLDTFVPTPELLARLSAFPPQETRGLIESLSLLEKQQAQHATWQQQQFFEHYTQVICTIADRQPLLLLLDDLQWTDRASAGLLFHLGRRLSTSRILILGAYRPSEVSLDLADGEGQAGIHPLASIVNEFKRRYGDVEVNLGTLTADKERAFVDALLDREAYQLGEDFRVALFRRTGGHPLFMVELLREMQERRELVQGEAGQWVEGERVKWNTLPSRVEAVIARRVGRLPGELQEALKVASVQGESFIAEVVAQVIGIDSTHLVRQLSSIGGRFHRLVHSTGSERLGDQPLSHYRFRHILFQTYLYESLNPAERSYLHEAVGSALEGIFAEKTEQVALQLAHHFEMASLTAKAVEYLRQAAERATQLSAYEETIAHINRGLCLLQELPDTLERARQELRLHILHGVSLVAAKGWSSEEVQGAYERASVSAQRAGGVHQLVAVLHGLFSTSHVGGDVQRSLAIGKQCLELAKTQDDPALIIVGHYMIMGPSINLGELATAQAHAQRGLELYEPRHHAFHVSTFTIDVGIFMAVYGSHCTWYLGKADTALAQCRQATMAAGESSHSFSLTVAHAYLAMLYGFRRQWSHAQEYALATDALSIEHAFPYYHAWATYIQGWALTGQRELERGIALMEQAMADYRAMRTGLREPFYLAHLAEAYVRAGDASKGLHLLEEAFAAAQKHGERVHEAEIWRLRGEFLQFQGHATDEVEASFRRAIETAGRQAAKALELRAVISLSRLWQRQGRIQEARQLLGTTYAWFTEGFDTPDLLEAKILLAHWREDA